MLKNFTRSERKEVVEYGLVFDDGENNGYSFRCDENGVLPVDMPVAAQKNYAFCMEHPEKFVRFNKVVAFYRSFREPPHGLCECGREVYLYDQYLGACECECGRWYNLFGQELNHPSKWSEMEDW